jgi:hypothetical protein
LIHYITPSAFAFRFDNFIFARTGKSKDNALLDVEPKCDYANRQEILFHARFTPIPAGNKTLDFKPEI